MKLITRRLAMVVIIAAVSIGLLLQFMLWRIRDSGVESAIMSLADEGIIIVHPRLNDKLF